MFIVQKRKNKLSIIIIIIIIIIRTKLQAGQEEREIGLVTPSSPKGPSTGEPPEPDLGMLPPGPRKTIGGQPKPSTSAQQRLKPKKPSARSVKEAQEGLKRILAEKREEKCKKAAARMAKKGGQKAPKGGVKKRYRYQPGNCCLETDKAVSEIHGSFDQKAAFPTIGS